MEAFDVISSFTINFYFFFKFMIIFPFQGWIHITII